MKYLILTKLEITLNSMHIFLLLSIRFPRYQSKSSVIINHFDENYSYDEFEACLTLSLLLLLLLNGLLSFSYLLSLT